MIHISAISVWIQSLLPCKMDSQDSQLDGFFARIQAQLRAKAKDQSARWDYDFLADQPAEHPVRFRWEAQCSARASVSTKATNEAEEEEMKESGVMPRTKKEHGAEEEEGQTAIPTLHFHYSGF